MVMRIYGLYQKSRAVTTLLLALALCVVAVGCVNVIQTIVTFPRLTNNKWAVVSNHSSSGSMEIYEEQDRGCVYISSPG